MVRRIPQNAPNIGAYVSILIVVGGTHTSSLCGTIYEK